VGHFPKTEKNLDRGCKPMYAVEASPVLAANCRYRFRAACVLRCVQASVVCIMAATAPDFGLLARKNPLPKTTC
jgi:hypothetical protein